MKTTKLIATALILSIASLGFAQEQAKTATTPPTNQSIVMPLNKAMQSLELVAVMKAQLDPRFLEDGKRFYTVGVNYKHKRVYICGTYNEWRNFFNSGSDGDAIDCRSSRIPLTSAVKNAGLVRAIREQVNSSILHSQEKFITVHIKYKRDVLYIIGSYNQWKAFFQVNILVDEG